VVHDLGTNRNALKIRRTRDRQGAVLEGLATSGPRLSATRTWPGLFSALSSPERKTTTTSLLCTNFKDTETVSGLVLRENGPMVGCCVGLRGPGKPGELSLHFFFKFLFSVFIFYLIFLFEFRSDFYFVLQVQNYLNIHITS
jgi:hypothetical protein